MKEQVEVPKKERSLKNPPKPTLVRTILAMSLIGFCSNSENVAEAVAIAVGVEVLADDDPTGFPSFDFVPAGTEPRNFAVVAAAVVVATVAAAATAVVAGLVNPTEHSAVVPK